MLAMGYSERGENMRIGNTLWFCPLRCPARRSKNAGSSGIAVITSTHSGIKRFICTTGCYQPREIRKSQKVKSLLISWIEWLAAMIQFSVNGLLLLFGRKWPIWDNQQISELIITIVVATLIHVLLSHVQGCLAWPKYTLFLINSFNWIVKRTPG